MLDGYSAVIFNGTMMTLALALLAVMGSTLLGIGGALCRTSGSKVLRYLALAYTTLIRSVPDLVIMLLVFYNLQILVNALCEMAGIERIELDAFTAGVITVSFIYGAYMTETFRGALEAIPLGQIEAALSVGMKSSQIFRQVTFPQLMRYALPGYSNNIQVIIKATALVSIIGLVDIITVTQQAGQATQRAFFFNILAAAIYLALSSVVMWVLFRLDKRFNRGVKVATL